MGIIYKSGIAYGAQDQPLDTAELTALHGLLDLLVAANDGKVVGIDDGAFIATEGGGGGGYTEWEGGSY